MAGRWGPIGAALGVNGAQLEMLGASRGKKLALVDGLLRHRPTQGPVRLCIFLGNS